MVGRSLSALLVLLALAAPCPADPLDAAIGAKLFRRQWVSAPSSAKANDGLGPLFAASSCSACHPGGGASERLVIRLGRGDGGGDPVYGHQIQPFAVAGQRAEAAPRLAVLAGRPSVTLEGLAYGPLDSATRVGLRRPPPLAAAAAIADLGEEAVIANEGRAGGRARRLADGSLGRFGWKGSAASLEDQIAAAFSSDMGLSTTRDPDPHGECTLVEADCLAAPTGQDGRGPEIADPIVAALASYVRSLAVPAAVGRESGAGAAAFTRLGCPSCHVPLLRDRFGKEATIYSDLLLHDMGPGLDDGVAEPGVRSSEWRTAPLAGLGAHLAANGTLLHDGRAASIAEAIAAHGGGAAPARDAFAAAPASERAALESYLKGL
jgi:CxxC motif-containing protein (DUF1111 family)